MIIKFKKIHTISDKIYVSFGKKDENGNDIWTAFPIVDSNGKTLDYIPFGKNDDGETNLLEFSPVEDSEEFDKTSIPESLEDIKLFGRNKDEIWIPNFSKQRMLSYLNESNKSLYVDFQAGAIEGDWQIEKLISGLNIDSNFDIKVFNIKEEDIPALINVIKSSKYPLNLSSGVLPSKISYESTFSGISAISHGFELPDETQNANFMYRDCINLEKPISLYGNVTSAIGIFENCKKITEMPRFLNNKLITLNKAFSNTSICGDLRNVKLPESLQDLGYAFSETQVEYSPKIPKNIINFEHCFESSSIKTLPLFDTFKEKVNFDSAFMNCQNLGENDTDIGNLPNNISFLNSTFAGCTSLTQFYKELPSSIVRAIGAFQTCTSLVDAPILNEGLEDINYMFNGCSSLINPRTDSSIIKIPTTVKTMEGAFKGTAIERTPDMSQVSGLWSIKEAFFNCYNLKTVSEINLNAPLLSILDGFRCDESIIEEFPSIPYSVTDDFSYKFGVYSRDNVEARKTHSSLNPNNTLKKFGSIYNNVTSICGIFNWATNLEKVGNIYLGNTTEFALNQSFNHCHSLKSGPIISVLSGTPNADELYNCCTSLERVGSIPKASSFRYSFRGCSSLTGKGINEYKYDYDGPKHFNLPLVEELNDNNIEVDVFGMYSGCTSLKEISFPLNAKNPSEILQERPDVEEWDKLPDGTDFLPNVEILNNLPKYVSSEEIVKTIKLFPNVKIIKSLSRCNRIDNWFKDLKGLQSCGIGTDSEIISMESAFEGCTQINNTKIFNDVDICEAIANPREENGWGLEIVFPLGVKNIKKAFKNCTQIEYISEIPYFIEDAEEVFMGCSNLKKIGKLNSKYFSDETFKNAFKNSSLEEIDEIGPDGEQCVKLGVSSATSLKKVGYISATNIEGVFDFPNSSNSLEDVTITENVENMEKAFRNCSSLSKLKFLGEEKSESIPSSVTNLDFTFSHSGITINEDNYKTFFVQENEETGEVGFKIPLRGLESSFEYCPNITYMPLLPNFIDAGTPVLKKTFFHCEGLSSVSLLSGVDYDETFSESYGIERCEVVPLGVNLKTNTFNFCSKLKTIGLLEHNFGFSKTAFSWTEEVFEDLVTEKGKALNVISGINSEDNTISYNVLATSEEELEEKIEEFKKLGNVTRSKATLDSYYSKEAVLNEDNEEVETEKETKVYKERILVTYTKNSAFQEGLENYIEWLASEEYIKTTKYINQTSVATLLTTYFSSISNYFPYLEVVEQLGAQNCSGILATGDVFETDLSGKLLNVGSEVGPVNLKDVPGISKVEGGEKFIANESVSSLSHAFYGARNLKNVGSIPRSVTGLVKPFEKCESLETIGNIYANSDDYSLLCYELHNLKSIGDLGVQHGISKILDSAFDGCTSLEKVGKINSVFCSFNLTFSECSSLKEIGYLSYESLMNAKYGKASNVEYGYSYDNYGGYDSYYGGTDSYYGYYNNYYNYYDNLGCDINGMFYKASSGFTIKTDKKDIENVKKFLIENCVTLRNNDSSESEIFPYESCLEWAQSIKVVEV